MSDQYKGMRWLKCDLQMQTPADSLHWLGDQMIHGSEKKVARSFAEACYEKRLDVVGITDHNFLGKDFLPLLKVAFGQIFDMHGHRITMFPGFEFEAAYGGPSCQDRFYDFCKHILEEVISSLRREVLVALSLRRCLV